MEFTIDKLAKDVAEKALDDITYEGKTIREWIDILAKQQTSEDCVSRDAMMKCFKKWQPYMATRILGYEQELSKLPSVTPQLKKGHWIYTSIRRLDDETDEGCIYITDYRCSCSECGGDFGFQKMSDAYCKYCGAKMEVEE